MPAGACPSVRCSHLPVHCPKRSRNCHLTLQQASTTCFCSPRPPLIMLSMSIFNSKCRFPPMPHSEIQLRAFFVHCFHAAFTLPPHSSPPPPIPNLLAFHSVCGAITTKVGRRSLPLTYMSTVLYRVWSVGIIRVSFTATRRTACARLQIFPSSPATAYDAGAAQCCPWRRHYPAANAFCYQQCPENGICCANCADAAHAQRCGRHFEQSWSWPRMSRHLQCGLVQMHL